MFFEGDPTPVEIVKAINASQYRDVPKTNNILGRESWQINDLVFKIFDVMWAPDGDEAFDDGSHVLQFDVGDDVVLIAYLNSIDDAEVLRSVRSVGLKADTFYDVLEQWSSRFEREWLASQA